MGFKQQKRLLSLRTLRFMSDAEKDFEGGKKVFPHILLLSH